MSAMTSVDALLQIGALRTLDHALAQTLFRLRPDTPAQVLLAAALCSRALAQGHSRLPLARVEELLAEIAPDGAWPPLPALESWRETLRDSPWRLSSATGVDAAHGASGDRAAPQASSAQGGEGILVLEDDAVSLRRYWRHEVVIAAALRARLSSVVISVDPATRARIAAAFSGSDDPLPARAAEVALQSRLLLLTGGPGTGKTRTVATILGLLGASDGAGAAPRIALAAPTGKAAARLADAVREHAGLSLPAQTLHRLLGLGGDGRPPRFDANQPLPFDIVVVDEASMIDLPMMARLLAAVASDARLLLIGDPDQLPSVDVGAVLGALCDAAGSSNSAAIVAGDRDANAVRPPTNLLARHHVHLQRNHRHSDALAIAPLSAAIRAGDGDGALALLDRTAGLHWQRGNDAGLAAFVREHALTPFRRLQACPDLSAALAEAQRFRVLTAVRDGPAGSATINALIAAALRGGAGSAFFPGRLVLVTENSYRHGLFNGDIGLCWPDADSALRVWFQADGGGAGAARGWHPAQLPAHDSAFALTVHKAQGSEFGQVLLALPEHDARVISRELLYTGLSRGRDAILLWAAEPVLRAGIARKMTRWNGLAPRLRQSV